MAEMDLVAEMGLVWKVIRATFPRGDADRRVRRLGTCEDLAQEGFLALCRAARSFDPGRGRWSTHAWMHVRYHLMHVTAAAGIVAAPHARRAARTRFAADADRARACRVLRPRSAQFLFLAGPAADPADAEERARALEAVGALPANRAFVVREFLAGKTFAQVGAETGRSTSVVSQLYRASVGRLREALGVTA